MDKHRYKMKSEIWLYPGMTGLHFVTLPKKQSAEIKDIYGGLKRGWGSLPVVVTIGSTNWRTSIFPDKKSGAYILPLKADVRKKEELSAGDTITFAVEVRV